MSDDEITPDSVKTKKPTSDGERLAFQFVELTKTIERLDDSIARDVSERVSARKALERVRRELEKQVHRISPKKRWMIYHNYDWVLLEVLLENEIVKIQTDKPDGVLKK